MYLPSFLIFSVLSDFYTGDGQTEKALIAEQIKNAQRTNETRYVLQ